MDFLKGIKEYEATIYLLSAGISLASALVIFSLRRNTRILHEKTWTRPFAWAFIVLAVAYFFRFANFIITGKPEDLRLRVLTAICLGVTNFLFFLAAFRLIDIEPLFVKFPLLEQRLLQLRERITGKSLVWKIMLVLFLCLVSLIRVIGGWEKRIPGDIFTVLALFFIGYVLYRNISFRRDKLMAWFGLLSSVCYAILYFCFLYIHYLEQRDGWTTEQKQISSLLVFVIALILRGFLFFSGYSLMLLISGPVEGIERLLASATHRQGEYLENGGIVRSIQSELQVTSVRLYIRLPGLKENQLALYSYPAPDNGDNKASRKIDYTEGTDYDRVMKNGEPCIRYRDENSWLMPMMSTVTVPLFYHNSVIACLEAEVGKDKFTKADQDNLLRIATLISPAVQAYREVSALNKISEDLAQLQIKVVEYKIEWDISQIVAKVQNVVSPLAMGISIEAGFLRCRGTYPTEGPFAELINEQLDGEIDEGYVADSSGDYLWLKKGLKVSPVDSEGREVGVQFIGKFVFATDKEAKTKEHPTLATNFLYHSAVSILITDTLLDFIRGYLNQLTDRLGVQLSGLQGTEPSDWLGKTQVLAKEAGLVWMVASYPDNDELLGARRMVQLVNTLEKEEFKQKWELKEEGLWLYPFGQSESGAYYVIKKVHQKLKQTLWFGVAREGFGPELNYTSPWKFFVDHFSEIANSALHRILNIKNEEERKKQIVEFQGLATAAITTGTVIHQLVNHVRNLTHPLTALEFMPKQGPVDGQRRFISYIRQASNQIDDLVKLFAGVVKPDERRPCALDEAVNHAIELLKDSLMRYAITVENQMPPRSIIDVPFHVAANALVNVVNNAKEAIRDGAIKNGLIQIKVEERENMFICHITDNGPGVPQAIQKTLFKALSKSDKPYSHGIGLYLSAHSLRENGGNIILTYSGPEPGTTFSIRFPKIRDA